MENPDIFGNDLQAGVMQKTAEPPGLAVPPSPGTDPPAVRPRRINPEAQRPGAINGSCVAAERRHAAAVHADQRIRAFVFLSRAEGLSLQAIADEMTARRWPTRQGGWRWHAAQVQRVIERTLPIASSVASDLEAIADALRTVARRERRRRRARQKALETEATEGQSRPVAD
jgi:hypothetical protein